MPCTIILKNWDCGNVYTIQFKFRWRTKTFAAGCVCVYIYVYGVEDLVLPQRALHKHVLTLYGEVLMPMCENNN